MKSHKNKEHSTDPYKGLEDGNNAIKEFYKLKHKLCLTQDERDALGITEWSDRW
jgi:hypothetical protein